LSDNKQWDEKFISLLDKRKSRNCGYQEGFMITNTQHVGICVTNIEKIIVFYRDILGLKLTADFEMAGKFLDTVQGKSNMNMRIVKFVTPEGFMFEFLQDRGHVVAPQKENSLQAAGLRHFAYEVDDVDQMYEKVKVAGYETISTPCTSDDGGMRLFFVYDPELNLVEFVQTK
jgi:catechol 2,3-dioxygenase-like lactoylglutathione lyase family enzyme